jgi:flagellar biosynthesis protein FlhG
MTGWLPLERPVPPANGAEPAPRASSPRRGVRPGRIVSVGGGKGGVGKSLVAASLGIELARQGARVVLVDADLGGANLHTCLGLAPPRRTLSDFVIHHVDRIEEVLVATGIPNLSLVSGAFDHLDAANPPHAQKMRLIRHLQSLEAEFLILDLGAGTRKNTLDFFLMADHGILVLIPEHGAVENAYRFVKAAFWRRLRAASVAFALGPLLERLLDGRLFRGPAEILDAIQGADPEAGRQLRAQMAAFRPRLVVNQARVPEDAEFGRGVVEAWRRHFGIEMDLLGTVAYDDDVWRSVRERLPLLRAQPEGSAARALAAIASRIRALDATAATGP